MLYRTKDHFAFGIKGARWTVAMALIALLMVFAVWHFGAPLSSKATAAADPSPRVDVVSPRRATVAQRLQSNATLEAFEETDMYAKISGYLSEVSVDIGDHIKAGQILAVVNVPEMEKELAEAEAQLESRKRSAESARLQVNHNKADLALQEVTLKRLETLAYRGTGRLVSEQAVDESRARTEVSRADLEVAESNRALAAAQVELATATVEKTRALLAYSKIVAPFDGIVAQRLVNRGDLVQAATGTRTTPLFKVIRIDTIRVFCDVPENEVRHVRVGDPATVKPFGFDGAQFTGTITRFAVRLNPETRNMRTEIDLANRDERLYPGMYAEVSFEMNRRPDVLTVPTSAIGTDGSGTFVYTVTGDRIERLPVKVGLSDGGRIEVAEGLSEEATVVMVAKSAPPAATAVHPNPVNF
jgi:RND family efflux transporter MFP subunit